MATIEEKAAAFDALCRELQGKHRFSHHMNVPIVSTTAESQAGETTAQVAKAYRAVTVYEWQLFAYDSTDIEEQLLKLAKKGA